MEEILEEDVAEVFDLATKAYARAKSKLKDSPHIEGKHAFQEVTNNLYPLILSMLQVQRQQEEALLDLVEGGEILAPETAATVIAALDLGQKLADFVKSDPEGVQHAAAFEAASAVARAAIQALVDDGPEDDNPEDEDGEDDEEDNEDGEEE